MRRSQPPLLALLALATAALLCACGGGSEDEAACTAHAAPADTKAIPAPPCAGQRP